MWFFKVVTDDVLDPKRLRVPLAVVGSWFRLLAACARTEKGGLLEGAKGFDNSQWLVTAFLSVADVEAVVAADLAKWDGQHLRVVGYDVDAEASVLRKRKGGRKGGLSSKAKRRARTQSGGASSTPSSSASSSASSTPSSSASSTAASAAPSTARRSASTDKTRRYKRRADSAAAGAAVELASPGRGSEATKFTRWWDREYLARFGSEYLWQAKDKASAKALLEKLGLKKLVSTCADAFDLPGDHWLVRDGLTIGRILQHVNQVPVAAKRLDRTDDGVEAAALHLAQISGGLAC